LSRKPLIICSIILSLILFHQDAYSRRTVIDEPIREGQFIDRTDIEEVIVEAGRGITEIPDYAFLGCTALRKVTLPEGLKKIGFQAFSECSGLEEINFPSTLEDIGSNSFTYCANLDGLVFPAGLKHIGHNAFSFCSSLSEVLLPDSMEEIESYAFSDCDSLRKVRLPANDRLLGELMMNCCPMLTEIVAPSPRAPKFDCESFIFDPEDKAAYDRCVLKVPENAIDSYIVSKSWQMFNKIAMCK
ncbi:MAG: leucine-rich repeat domain-containing protein, partial [Muribaculaceae bacterium]|nr:leucine-rich repeat domain-containing protein [Muribaculaceae bacterium]